MNSKISDIKRELLEFRRQRDWKQFHDPKNLAEAISIEAGELLEHFLWKKTDDPSIYDKQIKDKVSEELADLFIFITYLCDAYQIDILEEVKNKIEINEKKYPVEKARSKSLKYTDL